MFKHKNNDTLDWSPANLEADTQANNTLDQERFSSRPISPISSGRIRGPYRSWGIAAEAIVEDPPNGFDPASMTLKQLKQKLYYLWTQGRAFYNLFLFRDPPLKKRTVMPLSGPGNWLPVTVYRETDNMT